MLKLLGEALEEVVEPRDIYDIYRLGKKSNAARRPIRIKFVTLHMKKSTMKKYKFFNSKGIEIYDDFPKEIREHRKSMLPLMKQLKERGMRASLRANKLIVNGKNWTLSQAQEFIDDPMDEIQNNTTENSPEKQSKDRHQNGKRSRTSPTDKSPVHEPKKKPPNLKLPHASKIKAHTVPSPISSSPRLTTPIVATPQKNMQYTTIVRED